MKKTWIIIISCIAALLLVGGGILAAVLLGGNEEPAKVDYDGKLYWNVEREAYKDGVYPHRNVGDDLYRLLFSVDGEQVELDVKGHLLVKYIDTMDVMGLVFDENGTVVEALHVNECTGGYALNKGYVTQVSGNTVTVNSNYAFRGLSKTLELTENTGIYNVGLTGPVCGIPGELSYNDEIIAIQDEEGNITHVYTKPYQAPGNIYWNCEKKYDSVTKRSTREPDMLMRYEFQFVVNGEEVTLYCKDEKVVNQIDAARIMGLELDEEGYISKFVSIRTATNGGRSTAVNYYVSDTNYRDGQILMRNKAVYGQETTTVSYFKTDNCKIYDLTGNDGTVKGQSTELQKDDRVICILDSRNRIDTIFVCHRYEGRKLYWNVDRAWDSANKTTKRTPDKDGWYYFKMAVDGQHVTVKTDSLAIANAIEKPVCVGLRLKGDVVQETISATSVCPGGVFASYLYIKELKDDGTVVAERLVDGKLNAQTAKLAENCDIFNVSAMAELEGERITAKDLQVGDTIHGYLNTSGEVCCLYQISSMPTSPIYWNVDKAIYWDAANKTSTRVPDADGWYNICVAVYGEQMIVRTKDKAVVDDIDNRTCMGLLRYGSNILKVYGATATLDTQGGLFASQYYVTAIDGNKITAEKLAGVDAGKVVTATMKPNVQIYDVSSTASMVGEKSTVQVGDQIRGLLNKGGQISVLYVLNASNHETHTCVDCGKDVTWMAWNGSETITKSGHYVLTSDVPAAGHGIYWTEDLNVTLCLNGYELSAPGRRVFSNVTGTLNIVDCKGTGHVHGTTNNNASITLIDGGAVNIYGGKFTADEITEAKNGGLFTIMGGGQLNLMGGTISGGTTNGYGGNINVSDGTFKMTGGTVTGGHAKGNQPGGNIALSGDNAVMIMTGGTVENGTATGYGGNIAVTKSGAKLQITGGTIKNGTAATHGGNLTVAAGSAALSGVTLTGGTAPNYGSAISAVSDSELTITDSSVEGQVRVSSSITLGGKVTIDDLLLYNIKLQTSGTLSGAVGISMSAPGVFFEGSDLTGVCTSVSDSYVVAYEGGATLLKSAGHRHCLCVGSEAKPDDHTCDTQTWEAVTGTKTLGDGYYYLDFTAKAAAITVADGKHAHLCLNGAKIYAMKTITMGEGSALDICDCTGKGQIGLSGGATRGPIVIETKCTVNLYSGTVNGTMNSNSKQAVTMNKITARFNMYGGTITGGVSTSNGGNVKIQNGQFHMYGGIITGGQAKTYGGNVVVAGTNGGFYLYGGKVEKGSATTHGGNICISNGSMEMTGGTISGGTAKTNGGSISMVNNAKCAFTGGKISGGSAEGNGNGIYCGSGNVTLGGDFEVDAICIKNKDAAITVSTDKPWTATNVITLTMETVTEGAAVIKNFTDLTRFQLGTTGYSLQVNGTDITIKTA